MGLPKKTISRSELNYLYWIKRLSTAQIGKIFGCNHVTILNKLKEFNIKRRTRLGNRKPVVIPAKILKNLYVDRKLSETIIAKRLGYSRHAIEIRMKLYGIKPRSYRESNTKYPKTDFSGNLIEKAYITGFRLGDLSVSIRSYLIHVGCSSTIQAQVKLIKNLFSPYTFVYTKPSRILNGKQVIDIQCLLNESFEFLLPKQDSIEDWILNNNGCFFAFTAGYIDAEGHIYTRTQYKKTFSGLEIQTYDKNILKQMWHKFNQLGIKCPKPLINKRAGYTQKNGTRNNKDAWRLGVSKKQSLSVLFNRINPYIKHDKREKDLYRAWKDVNSRL